MKKKTFCWVTDNEGNVLIHSAEFIETVSKVRHDPEDYVLVKYYPDGCGEDGRCKIVPTSNVFFKDVEWEGFAHDYTVFESNSIYSNEPAIIPTRLTIPEVLRNSVYDRDGRKCRQCGTEEDLTIDHIYPFSKGGKTEIDNLQTLCGICNRKKRAKV